MGRIDKEQSASDNPMKEFSSRYFCCFKHIVVSNILIEIIEVSLIVERFIDIDEPTILMNDDFAQIALIIKSRA